MLGPITHEDLDRKIYLRLARAIFAGTLAPGERLVEDQLAARLGVSRAPVRDALRALEHDGLVESVGRRGKIVSSLSPTDAWEVYSLRGALEGLAFRIAVGKVSEPALAELNAIVEEMTEQGRRGDVQALSALDVRFHEAACRLSGHGRLLRSWTSMSRQIRLLSQRVVDTLYSDLEEVPTRHAHLVELLRAGDPEAAEQGVRLHIDSVARRVTALLHEAEERSASDANQTPEAGQPL